jgi:hypothetical protein
MNELIVNEFMQFYYNNLNTKENDTCFKHIIPHLKQHSIFIRDNKQLKGEKQIIDTIFKTPYQFIPQKIDILINGERRANVMVSGQVTSGYNEALNNFSEYFHLAYGNDKQYWIHTSILQFQK